jgi:hypothetical protein
MLAKDCCKVRMDAIKLYCKCWRSSALGFSRETDQQDIHIYMCVCVWFITKNGLMQFYRGWWVQKLHCRFTGWRPKKGRTVMMQHVWEERRWQNLAFASSIGNSFTVITKNLNRHGYNQRSWYVYHMEALYSFCFFSKKRNIAIT